MLLPFKALIIALIISITAGPGLAIEPPHLYVQVNSDNINIRADCTTGSEIICQANKGDILEVFGEKYDWYKIHLPKQAGVYIKEELVELKPSTDPTVQKQALYPVKAEVSATNVNIRLGPSLESRIIGRADRGETIEVIDNINGWYKIAPSINSYGWIHGKFIQDAPEVTTPPETKRIDDQKSIEEIE